MNRSEITILIPTYYRPGLLRRAINSVLEQSYSNYLVRVHDNGSDKETSQLMLELTHRDQRIKYLRHKENIGALGNFRTLLGAVDTPFYLLLSDDDFLLPGHLSAGIATLNKNPEAYFYSSATITVNLAKNELHMRNQGWPEGFYEPSKEITKRVIREHFTSTGTIYSRRVLDLINNFHGLGMDDVLSVLLTGCFPFCVSPKPGAVFTINEKRERCHSYSSISMEQILISSALDRKFVLDYSSRALTFHLLSYLEKIYASVLANKAICDYRSNLHSKSPVFDRFEQEFNEYFLRRSPFWFLKAYAPAKMLNWITKMRTLLFNLQKPVTAPSIDLTALAQGAALNYLQCGSIDDREAFIRELERLTSATCLRLR